MLIRERTRNLIVVQQRAYHHPSPFLEFDLPSNTTLYTTLTKKRIFTPAMPGTRSSRPENEGNELAELLDQRLSNEEIRSVRSRGMNRQASIQLEDANVEHGSLKEIDPDESARMWADLKAETGHFPLSIT